MRFAVLVELFSLLGILRYYMLQMENMINCEYLKTQVFQRLREIGNAILFCQQLEHAVVS